MHINKVLEQGIKQIKETTEQNRTVDIEWILSQKNLFVEYAKSVIPNFQIDERNRQIISDLFDYFIGFEGNLDLRKGLWIEGELGTGKSSLMQAFSKFMCAKQNGFRIHICSQVSTLYSIHGFIDQFTYNIESYAGKPIVMCFDELGREPIPAMYYGAKLNVMQHILHIRYSLWQTAGLKTYITTNLDAAGVEELYGDFIRDRRKEMFNIITMTGESRRN